MDGELSWVCSCINRPRADTVQAQRQSVTDARADNRRELQRLEQALKESRQIRASRRGSRRGSQAGWVRSRFAIGHGDS